MKKFMLLLGIVAIAAMANALPTLSGPTGGYTVPTAEIAQDTTIMVDYFDNSDVVIPNISAVTGISEKLEVGAQFNQSTEMALVYWPGMASRCHRPRFVEKDVDTWNVNAKYLLVPEMNIAVGASYGNDGLGGYLATTKNVFGMKGTVLAGINEDSTWEFGLALAKTFNEVTVGAEYLTGLGEDNGAAYVIVPLSDLFTVRAGLDNIGIDTKGSLGLGYSF